jgi:hypothetical protein
MRKRPLSITIISWLFIAAGAVGLAYHATEFKALRPSKYELVWVSFVRLLAIVAGVFMLRGRNWARWLLVLWLAYHVGLSFLHTPFELIVHGLLFLAVLYFLFRAPARVYFSKDVTAVSSHHGK